MVIQKRVKPIEIKEVDYGTWIVSVEEYEDGSWIGVLTALDQTLSTPPYESREMALTEAYALFKELKN